MLYIHYKFKDIDKNLQNMFFVSKKELISRQLEAFQTNFSSFKSANPKYQKEMEGVLKTLTSPEAEKQRVKIFVNNQNEPLENFIKPQGINLDNWMKINSEHAELFFIGNELGKFVDELNKVIKDLVDKLNISDLDTYKRDVLNTYLNTHQNDPQMSEEIARDFINNFLKHDGLKSLKDPNGAEYTILRKMILLAEALPNFSQTLQNSQHGGKKISYSTKRKEETEINSYSEFFDVVAKKIRGWTSGAKGALGEEVCKMGELDLLQIFARTMMEKFSDSGLTFEVKKIGADNAVVDSAWEISVDPAGVQKKLKEIAEAEIKKVKVSKGDVAVYCDKNGGEILYAFSVKTPGKKTKSGATNVKLVDETPFLTSAQKVLTGNQFYLMYNLAAAHPDEKEFSENKLNKKWDELKRTVVYSNFLDYLVGLPSERVYYMVIGKKIYKMEDIIKAVEEDPDRLRHSINTKEAGLISRKHMTSLNNWLGEEGKKNKDKGNERSDKLVPQIKDILEQAKIRVNLNYLNIKNLT